MYKRINLNGKWKLEPGSAKPNSFNHNCEVPALIDVSKLQFNWQKYDYFWYCTSFRIPQNCQFAKVILQLEQVKYGTEIWLNDRFVGSDIPCYTSQEFDLTNFVTINSPNTLLVRVGSKYTLPTHSAVGNDFEKLSFIPGIWGDVWLHFYGPGKIEWTRIIPDIEKESVHIFTELKNFTNQVKKFRLEFQIQEKNKGRIISTKNLGAISVLPAKNYELELDLEVPNPHLWSPEDPFLYLLNCKIVDQDQISHQQQIQFGMRKFEIRDGHFYLNGTRRTLLGSNIAFHRLLSDETRGLLPWNLKWIKKVLVDIPKSHNMFFFRIHLGHAYNKWYDIADEFGILLQDEWMFWPSTGTPNQIEREFQCWIKENINHPSIIIWDPLNESEDSNITEGIIPRLKKIDPTRPWECVDFTDDHSYIYSLGPVLNGDKFGHSRSIFELQKSLKPTMVSEYVWWWLDRNNQPTSLTKIVLERWLGNNPSLAKIVSQQKFIVTELTELWRRLNIDAIMPFIYLSAGTGPTANWFTGTLSKLQLKPVMKTIKRIFSPVLVSIELWDRHFLSSEQRDIPVFLINDGLKNQTITFQIYFKKDSSKILLKQKIQLKAGEHLKLHTKITFPIKAGANELIAKISSSNGTNLAESRKPVYIFNPIKKPKIKNIPRLTLADPSNEVCEFLKINQVNYYEFPKGIEDSGIILLNGKGIEKISRKLNIKISKFVSQGGILILQEPEEGVSKEAQFKIVDNLELNVKYRRDEERGGFDSYVFPENNSHFIWKGLNKKNFQLLNGAIGGEIVSQHFVRPTQPFHTVASCNFSLAVPAIMEIPYGRGWILISRLQIRGRLLPKEASYGIFDRRYDPVAEKYFWNLLFGYIGKSDYQSTVKKQLAKKKIYIAQIKSSTQQVYDIVDGKIKSRWNFKENKPQWLWIDFGKKIKLISLSIEWEIVYSKTFQIFQSNDNLNWELVFEKNKSSDSEDFIKLPGIKSRYLKIEYNRESGQFSYSIWKMKINS